MKEGNKADKNTSEIYSYYYLFNLVIFELYTKLLSFSSTQGSEMDRFAFEHIQGLKASATPAPKTSLKLSGPFWCVKFTCNTEDDIR